MNHLELQGFGKYRDGANDSQTIARDIINFVEETFGVRPSETANGFLLYPDNFLLIETIHQRQTSVTINLSGPASLYDEFSAPHIRVTAGQAGYSKLYITDISSASTVHVAIRRSWNRRHGVDLVVRTQIPERHYWITTQWPMSKDRTDEHHGNIYLQEGCESVGRSISAGDRVLIYESKSGKVTVVTQADGTIHSKPNKIGRAGIVTVADVAGPLVRRPPAEAIHSYLDGTTTNWAWKAPTQSHVSNGFTPMADVLRVLGYSPRYTLRGFGDMNSGLKELTQEEYDELLRIFVSNSNASAPAPGGRNPRPGHWTEGGGEGPEHLLLKEYVAANPSIDLAEEGVTTYRVEYPFPSGDRADIALRDQAGRFIGLEVELSQSNAQIEGLLQAVKYRHMLAVMEGVTFEECRSVLAAYELGGEIKALCIRYDVLAIEIGREKVRAWNQARTLVKGHTEAPKSSA